MTDVLRSEQQEMFNTVVEGLMITQRGRRALDQKNRCMYRAPNGDKCAFGWLIPDSLYDPEMEHKGSKDILAAGAQWSALRRKFRDHTLFVSDLQSAHDCANDTAGLAKALKEVGNQYDLELPDCIA